MAELTPRREPTDNGRQPDPDHLLQAVERSAIDDDHLGDADLIELSAGVLDEETMRSLQTHLSRCAQCRSEAALMQTKALEWAQHGPAVPLRDRLRSAPAEEALPEEPWWTRIASWIPLTPVRRLQGAYASGQDTAEMSFPVYDGASITPALRGSLQRRNSEYYVRISVEPDAAGGFEKRQVEIVLADPASGEVMLQRKVQFDQILLLGTNLQITTQQITARLIP